MRNGVGALTDRALNKERTRLLARRASVLSTGVIAGLVYCLTLAPTLTWSHDGADGGDLAAAILTGGVPHPPGYPTYLLLGELVTRLPIGDPAFRLNLFSTMTATAAVLMVGWTTAHLVQNERRWLTTPIACLALAFSPLLWSQAVITEVYAPAALAVALILWIALTQPPGYRRSFALGASIGLGLGLHPTLIFLFPLVAMVEVLQGFSWQRSRHLIAGLAIGLVPYLWLFLRAQRGSPVNWGQATTLEGWWWLVSGKLYQPKVFGLDWLQVPGRLFASVGILTQQFTPLGALLALAGFCHLWRRDRFLTIGLGLVALCFSIFAIGYDSSDSYLYLIPVNIILAIGLGVALAELWSDRRGSLTLRWFVVILGLVILVLQLRGNWEDMDLHDERIVQRFSERVLSQAPPDAILVTSQDNHTFALWYYHYGLGYRSDIVVVDEDLWTFDWYRDQLDMRADLSPDLEVTLANSERPVCTVGQEGELDCGGR